MHAQINIFYTVLVQNIENGKLHRQVDSVDAGLNQESKSPFFSQCGHFIAYMKVSKEKLFMLIMIEFLLLLPSFEMKCLRSLVGVSRMDRVRNEEVRRRAGIEGELASRAD